MPRPLSTLPLMLAAISSLNVREIATGQVGRQSIRLHRCRLIALVLLTLGCRRNPSRPWLNIPK